MGLLGFLEGLPGLGTRHQGYGTKVPMRCFKVVRGFRGLSVFVLRILRKLPNSRASLHTSKSSRV